MWWRLYQYWFYYGCGEDYINIGFIIYVVKTISILVLLWMWWRLYRYWFYYRCGEDYINISFIIDVVKTMFALYGLCFQCSAFCPLGSGTAIRCPGGTYGSIKGLFTATCSGQCTTGPSTKSPFLLFTGFLFFLLWIIFPLLFFQVFIVQLVRSPVMHLFVQRGVACTLLTRI